MNKRAYLETINLLGKVLAVYDLRERINGDPRFDDIERDFVAAALRQWDFYHPPAKAEGAVAGGSVGKSGRPS